MHKKIRSIFNIFKKNLLLFSIVLMSILLRLITIYYGYIGNEDGILLYNSKLARSGLIPFINYNGWNSLLTDLLNQIPSFFLSPSILQQRFYGLIIALSVFVIILKICSNFGNRNLIILTALLLGLGCPLYIYFSNVPFSEQHATFFTSISLFMLTKSFKKRRFMFDIIACFFSVLAVLVRSQALIVLILVWLYLIIYRNYAAKFKFIISFAIIIFGVLIYTPYFLLSWENTLYGIFWPFFANKLLLYVYDNDSITLGQLTSFITLTARDYGIYLALIITGIFFNFKKIFLKNEKSGYILLIIFICLSYFVTGVIHHPADSSYIYPSIPFLSFLAGFFTVKQFTNKKMKQYFVIFIVLLIFTSYAIFPHHKFIKISLSNMLVTPHSVLHKISSYLEDNSNSNDLILTMHMPVVAAINRNVPLTMNEGPGSISIIDSYQSEKWHLTSHEMLKNMIANKQIKFIILINKSKYYFGKNDFERNEIMNVILENYKLFKIFDEFGQMTGPNSETLYIYSIL